MEVGQAGKVDCTGSEKPTKIFTEGEWEGQRVGVMSDGTCIGHRLEPVDHYGQPTEFLMCSECQGIAFKPAVLFTQPEADPEVPGCGLAAGIRAEIEHLRDAATAGERVAASDRADELESGPGLKVAATANRRTADRLEALLADCQSAPELLGGKVGEGIASCLRAHDEVRWDRFIEYSGKVRVYGWLDRSDGHADFLLLDFDRHSGALLEWITSANPHPLSVIECLEGDDSVVCQRVEHHFDVANAVRLSASTQPVSESPGDSGVGTRFIPWGSKRWRIWNFDAIRSGVEGPETLPPHGAPQQGLKATEDAPIEVMAVAEHEAILRHAEEEIGRLLATQPVPGNSGGVEEGEAEKLSFEDLEGLAKAAAQAAAPVFRAQGWTWRDTDDCEFVPGEDELQEKVHHLLHRAQQRVGVASISSGRFHVDAEIEDGREVATVLLNLRDSLDAVSTQLPSPQAEVQDCSCKGSGCPKCNFGGARCGGTKVISVSDTVSGFRTLTGCRGCPDCTGKQSPAEPQDGAVEKLAKKFWQLRTLADNLPSWEELTDEERAGKLDNARAFLAAITPLLSTQIREEERHGRVGKIRQDEDAIRSSYALEVRERLEKLPRLEFGADPDHPGFTQLEPRNDGRFLTRAEVLAALDKEDCDV